MNVDQLEKQCCEVLQRGGDAVIVVRFDGRTMLWGNRGPRGELMCTNTGGQSVVRYKAQSVLKFLKREKQKAAKIKAAVNEVLK